MKCDHLIGRTFDGDVYILASDVMEAVSELKEFAEDACLERDDNQTAIDEPQAENAELKQKLEDAKATAYAESVDAGMRERKLKRALWLARANHADTMQKYNIECKCDGWVHRVNKWLDVERRCLKKAEEYK